MCIRDSFTISFPAIAVFYAQNVVDGIFKGTGDTRTPMRMAVLANAAILALDPLLIYGVGPLPELGVRGAALGTLLGRASALGVALTLLRRRQVTGPRGEPAGLSLGMAMTRILAVGLPASGDFILRMAIGATLLGLVARFGEGPLAAYGIGLKVMLLATMAFYALRQAGSILTARARGSGLNQDREIGRESLLLASVTGAAAGLLLAVSGRAVMGLFATDPAVVDAGTTLFQYLLPYLILLAGVVGLGGVFLGGGRTRSLLGVTALGACVQIPLAYGLSAVPALGVRGVWLSMVIATGVQWAMTYILFQRPAPVSGR